MTTRSFRFPIALGLAAGWLACATLAASPRAAEPSDAEFDAVRVKAEQADGRRLFAAHCSHCHGENGRGDGPDAQYFVRPPRDLRSGVLQSFSTDELVARVRDGAPLRLELDPNAMSERTRDVEDIVEFLKLLPDVDWAKVEPGNEVFLDRCEICHGPFGRPAPTMTLPPGVQRRPRDLTSPDFQKSVPDRELLAIVQHGRAGMPAIPALQSRSDAEVLVAFVRTLSPGRVLYGVYCSGCHGEDGRGARYVPPGFDRPNVVFDRSYFKRQDPEVLRGKVWHMLEREGREMPHLARRLSTVEAREIIEFLRRGGALEPSPTP